jgi:amino acid adenylation domain-containing protein
VVVARGADSPARAAADCLGLPVLELEAHVGAPAGVFSLTMATEQASASADAVDFGAADDEALVLCTSGTTSRPKIVPLTHANICASAASIGRVLALSGRDRCLAVMPLFHVHGLIGAVLSSVAAGASVACTPGFDAARFFEWLEVFAPTWYTAVPTIHDAVLDEVNRYPAGIARRTLRLIRSSSAALPSLTMDRLERAFGVPVIESYGMTEAAHQVASNALPPGERRPGSVGRTAGPEIAVMDERGALLPAGQTGEIVIRGASVMGGYADDPDANASAFRDAWFRTGDQGWMDGEGFIYLTARLGEIINRGGEKVSPREVDEVLLAHPAVARAVTFAVPHQRLGEDVVAAVVLATDADADEDALRDFALSRLAGFKVPSQIVFTGGIPAEATGKVRRVGLHTRLAHLLRAEFVAPRSTTEARVLALWRAVLERDRIGVHDNFFALGGDSLLGGRLIARINARFGLELPLVAAFRAPTPAGQALLIEKAREDRPALVVRIPRAATAPASFAQERVWLHQQRFPESVAYHRPAHVRLRGPLVAAALRDALTAIAGRHTALRTTVASHGGRLLQMIRESGPVELPLVDLIGSVDAEAQARRLAHEDSRRPFDLERGPLLHARLVRVRPDEHLLSLTLHHLAFDAWSQAVLLRELTTLYEAAIMGAGRNVLDALPIQYADAAAWERSPACAGAIEDGVPFWKAHLADPPALRLPLDFPRRPRPSEAAARVGCALPPDVLAGLRDLARHEETTLFAVLLSAFSALLGRYADQDDVVVGCPVAGRTQLETEGLIGLFINVLPLRTDLSGDLTFRELLRRTRESTLAALAHQMVPLQRIVQEVLPDRRPGAGALFDALFVYEHLPVDARQVAGVTCEPEDIDMGATLVDLSLELQESPRGVSGHFAFRRELWEPSSIERMAGHFVRLLRGIATDPDAPIGLVPLMTEVEQAQVVGMGERRDASSPASDRRGTSPRTTLHELFQAQARRTPDAVALESAPGAEKLTYRQLQAHASALARRLSAAGIGTGDRVGVSIERSAEALIAMLGILQAAAAFVPLDPAAPPARLAALAGDCRLSAIVVRDAVPATVAGCPVVAVRGDAIVDAPQATATADDPAYVLYTSGSSGAPAGVMVEHRSLVNYCLEAIRLYGVTPADRVLQFAPLTFDACLEEIFPTWLAGGTVVLRSDGMLDSVRRFVGELHACRITVASLPTAYWHVVCEALETESLAVPPSLRLVVLGGERAEKTRLAGWRRWAGDRVRLVNTYGPTETTVIATACDLVGPEAVDQMAEELPIGRPIGNVAAYVLDRRGRPVPVGVPGELYIGGAGVARGYVGAPDLTSARFVSRLFGDGLDPVYRTGDKVRWRADGNLEFLGRLDDQVKIRGHRVEPAEVERALCSHPRIRAAHVAARREPGGTTGLVAYVVAVAPMREDADEWRRHLAKRLPAFMIPAAFVGLPALPLTAHGKVDRRALPAPSEADGRTCELTLPASPLQRLLADVWRDVLTVERVGIHDSFFALGGHSLLAVLALSRIRAACGVELSLREFFEASTLSELALAVAAALSRSTGYPPDAGRALA